MRYYRKLALIKFGVLILQKILMHAELVNSCICLGLSFEENMITFRAPRECKYVEKVAGQQICLLV